MVLKVEPEYRYLAEVDRVVDGDTVDATIDLGFSIRVSKRLRLAGLNAPEIRRGSRASEKYKKGFEAKAYVERRLEENGHQMLVETGRRCRWGRWIATIFLPDSEKSLNEELIEKGLVKRTK